MTTVPPLDGQRSETHEIRVKRLFMRSWRRGMKEMDLILGRFADRELSALAGAELDAYEALLAENDQEIYSWICGREEAPEIHRPLVMRLKRFHADDPAV